MHEQGRQVRDAGDVVFFGQGMMNPGNTRLGTGCVSAPLMSMIVPTFQAERHNLGSSMGVCVCIHESGPLNMS